MHSPDKHASAHIAPSNPGIPVPAATRLFTVPKLLTRLGLLLLLACGPLLAGCDAYTWGANADGQLGDGTLGGYIKSPAAAAGKHTWMSLSAGWSSTCGVEEDGTLWCWGAYANGFMSGGFGVFSDSPNPVQHSAETDWTQVSAGFNHKCGIRAGGQLWCWGVGYWGQLGDGSFTDAVAPQRVGTASDWQEVSVGVQYSCGIRGAGNLYCWGNNEQGQLGLGNFNYSGLPIQVPGGPWRGVDAGNRHTCAIQATTDQPYCWGLNTSFQVNFSNTPQITSPVKFAGGNIFAKQIRAGSQATCVLWKNTASSPGMENVAQCVGTSTPDLDGATAGAYVGCTKDPCDPKNIPKFRQIDLGGFHACGVVSGTDDTMCWGAGTNGQLGNGSALDQVLPVLATGGKRWWRVSTGSSHTVASEWPE